MELYLRDLNDSLRAETINEIRAMKDTKKRERILGAIEEGKDIVVGETWPVESFYCYGD